jgi:hypothetical protein
LELTTPLFHFLSGWAYNELAATTSALELASNVLDSFLSSEQDYGYQATPKTMALVDTALYLAFRDAWDDLFSAMADILASGTDADFNDPGTSKYICV